MPLRALGREFFFSSLPENPFQSKAQSSMQDLATIWKGLNGHICIFAYYRELWMWFHIQLYSWPASWPWEITWCNLGSPIKTNKQKKPQRQQTNQPYLHKMTAGGFWDWVIGCFEIFTDDLVLRTYFCNLFQINRSWVEKHRASGPISFIT